MAGMDVLPWWCHRVTNARAMYRFPDVNAKEAMPPPASKRLSIDALEST